MSSDDRHKRRRDNCDSRNSRSWVDYHSLAERFSGIQGNFNYLSSSVDDDANQSGDIDFGNQFSEDYVTLQQEDPYGALGAGEGYFEDHDDIPREEEEEIDPTQTTDEGPLEATMDVTQAEIAEFIHYLNLPTVEFTAQKINDVEVSKEIPRDHLMPFDKHSTLKVTKGEACVGIHEIIARYGLKEVVVQEIFNWLAKNTQSLNLPVELKRKGEDYTVKLKDYIEDEDRVMVLDVCRNEHMVFHGMQTDPRDGVVKDASKLINCWHCGMQRYSKCTHYGCQTKDYAECNPYEGYYGHIGHSVTYRKPMRSAYYRRITRQLLKLYKKSLTAPHHNLLNYDNIRKKRAGIAHVMSLHVKCFT